MEAFDGMQKYKKEYNMFHKIWMTQSSHISIKTVIILLFAKFFFFFGGKLFRFSTKLKQKCVSASVFDFFCRRSRQALSNSFTSFVAEVFGFPFFVLFWGYSCKFVIMGGQLKEHLTGLWNNWMAWRRYLLLKGESLRTWWRGNINITFWHC